MADADKCLYCRGIIPEGYGHVCPVCTYKFTRGNEETFSQNFPKENKNQSGRAVRDVVFGGDEGDPGMDKAAREKPC